MEDPQEHLNSVLEDQTRPVLPSLSGKLKKAVHSQPLQLYRGTSDLDFIVHF